VLVLIFTVAGLAVMLTGYAFGLGGTLGAVVFLTFLFTGATLRYLQPLIARLRP
jgi:hypothetical protein